MEQNRRKTKLSRAQVRRLVIGAAIAAVVITAGAVYLRKRVTEQFGRGSTAEISSAEVISGSISTSVYGSGRLSDDDVEKLEIPSGVKLKEIRVSPGDKVDGGTLLASVNVSSVLAAMNDVSDQLSTLDSSISAAASSAAARFISMMSLRCRRALPSAPAYYIPGAIFYKEPIICTRINFSTDSFCPRISARRCAQTARCAFRKRWMSLRSCATARRTPTALT